MTDQDPEEALRIYRETHETYDDDIFVLSYLTFDEAQFEVRNVPGQKEAIFIPMEDFDERLQKVKQAPDLPPPVETREDQVVRHSNLDYLVEHLDSPQPLPPEMQRRVLKYQDIRRSDLVMMSSNRRRRR